VLDLLSTISPAEVGGLCAIGSAALATGLLPAFLSVHSDPGTPDADEGEGEATPTGGPDLPAPVAEAKEIALANRRAAYRRGVIVFIGLAILTIVEFALALTTESIVFLFVLGLAKAGLIVQYYMHAGKLWEGEEAHG
jgi:hypothetical protein